MLSTVISNWQVSGIFTFTSGAPLSITGTCTGGGIIDASCYPNYNPNFSGSVWQNGTSEQRRESRHHGLPEQGGVCRPAGLHRRQHRALGAARTVCAAQRRSRPQRPPGVRDSRTRQAGVPGGCVQCQQRRPFRRARDRRSIPPLSESSRPWPISRANCSSAPEFRSNASVGPVAATTGPPYWCHVLYWRLGKRPTHFDFGICTLVANPTRLIIRMQSQFTSSSYHASPCRTDRGSAW